MKTPVGASPTVAIAAVLFAVIAESSCQSRPADSGVIPEVANAVAVASANESGRGVRALDGDSVLVRFAGGVRTVRLVSIDAPEKDQPLADAARDFANAAVAGRELLVHHAKVARDRYDRDLGMITVDGELLNLALVETGFALVYVRPPNRERVDQLLAAQTRAYAARRGLWGLDPAPEEPRSFRERKRGVGKESRTIAYSRWMIVGNASSRLAHWPGCRHVDDMARGNRVSLLGIADAERKGFRMENGYE